MGRGRHRGGAGVGWRGVRRGGWAGCRRCSARSSRPYSSALAAAGRATTRSGAGGSLWCDADGPARCGPAGDGRRRGADSHCGVFKLVGSRSRIGRFSSRGRTLAQPPLRRVCASASGRVRPGRTRGGRRAPRGESSRPLRVSARHRWPGCGGRRWMAARRERRVRRVGAIRLRGRTARNRRTRSFTCCGCGRGGHGLAQARQRRAFYSPPGPGADSDLPGHGVPGVPAGCCRGCARLPVVRGSDGLGWTRTGVHRHGAAPRTQRCGRPVRGRSESISARSASEASSWGHASEASPGNQVDPAARGRICRPSRCLSPETQGRANSLSASVRHSASPGLPSAVTDYQPRVLSDGSTAAAPRKRALSRLVQP